MRRLVVNLDNTLDDFLKEQINQNETVRTALRLYQQDISTPDTVEGIKKSYRTLLSHMDEKFEYYDACFKRMDKLINHIENMMS